MFHNNISKIIPTLLFVIIANHAQAESCPSFYRFVDFGLTDRDGIIRRGGPIFRAFDVSGTHLLDPKGTTCRDVDDLAKDGRALDVPIVSALKFDAETANIDFLSLGLDWKDDAVAFSKDSATVHQERLTLLDAIIDKGTNYLCVNPVQSSDISCQIVSRFEGGNAPVIYCDDFQCEMPAMIFDKQIVISANWIRSKNNGLDVIDEIFEKMQEMYDFLDKQT